MREILFRGKRADTEKWVYGIPAKFRNVHGIVQDVIIQEIDGEHVMSEFCAVLPDTIGEYTGLTDKNGTRIFEGDILHNTFNERFGIVKFGDYASAMGCDAFTHHIGFCVDWYKGRSKDFLRSDLGYWVLASNCTLICGNIFDNPELLKDDTDANAL